MARDHARIQVGIWNDADFRALDVPGQHAYLMLSSQPRLSYCGVMDYIPGRLSVLSHGNTEAKIRAAIKTLERRRFAIVDRKTHEVLVRSYVRHDGVMDRVNMGKAVATAFANVTSAVLRDAILRELGRLYAEDSSLHGFIGFRELDPVAFEMATAMGSTMPLPMASGEE
jgi:hypothetical protein